MDKLHFSGRFLLSHPSDLLVEASGWDDADWQSFTVASEAAGFKALPSLLRRAMEGGEHSRKLYKCLTYNPNRPAKKAKKVHFAQFRAKARAVKPEPKAEVVSTVAENPMSDPKKSEAIVLFEAVVSSLAPREEKEEEQSSYLEDHAPQPVPMLVLALGVAAVTKSALGTSARLTYLLGKHAYRALSAPAALPAAKPVELISAAEEQVDDGFTDLGDFDFIDIEAAVVEPEVEAKPEAEPEAEPEVEAEVEAEPKVGDDIESLTKALAEATASLEAERKALAQDVANAEASRKADAEAIAKAEAEIKAELKAVADAKAKVQAKREAIAKAKIKADLAAISDGLAQVKAEREVLAKSEAERKALIEAKLEASANALADARAEREASDNELRDLSA